VLQTLGTGQTVDQGFVDVDKLPPRRLVIRIPQSQHQTVPRGRLHALSSHWIPQRGSQNRSATSYDFPAKGWGKLYGASRFMPISFDGLLVARDLAIKGLVPGLVNRAARRRFLSETGPTAQKRR